MRSQAREPNTPQVHLPIGKMRMQLPSRPIAACSIPTPSFSDPNSVILDDAHSAENYISSFWSLLIEKSNRKHEPGFSALVGVVSRFLLHSDKSRFAGDSKESVDRQ